MATTQAEQVLHVIPPVESKAREWVEQLPIADIGETTKRLYHGLLDLNRRVLPSATRIKISEVIRPVLDHAVVNLQRHLSYRAFPLPKKGQRIFDLNQALLLEFAGSYQLAALDMLTRNEVSKKGLQIAIYRAMDYMGQVLLSTYAVYVRTRDTIWHDIHQLYLVASEKGIDTASFSQGREGAKSIAARYLQINVLALTRPYALRQEEVFKVARYLETGAHRMTIAPELALDHGDYVHAVMLNTDEPAVIMPVGDLPHSPTVRVLQLKSLLADLETIVAFSNDGPASIIVKDGISRNLAQRLIQNLTTVCNRSFNRFPKSEPIVLVSRLPDILTALSRTQHFEQVENNANEEELLFGAPLKPAKSNQTTAQDEVLLQHWQVTNSSVSGYGLRWPHAELSGARVGEIVGLRDASQERNPWIIGVIKWMEQSRERGLCCGVEVLSSKTMPVSISKILNRDLLQPLPIDGLMLPSVEGIRPDPVLILPAYLFQPGDEVQVKINGRDEKIQLTLLDESLGAFAYFRFESMHTVEKTQTVAEEFSQLWGEL